MVGILKKWRDKIRMLWNNKENLNIQLENVDPVFAAECRCCAYLIQGATSREAPWGQYSSKFEKDVLSTGSTSRIPPPADHANHVAVDVTPANN